MSAESVNKETIITFRHAGRTYEIDHLGIGRPDQWGDFEVYCDGDPAADFSIPEASLRPEFRPASLPDNETLIRLALQAVGLNEAFELGSSR